MIEFTGSEAMKNGVSVRTELAEGFPPVRGDRVELQQVVLNLTLNAIEGQAPGRRSSALTIAQFTHNDVRRSRTLRP